MLARSLKQALQRSITKIRVIWHAVATPLAPLKLHIGAGTRQYKDWISTDVHTLDITNERDWKRYFMPNTIDTVLAEHVIEHLSPEDATKAFTYIYMYLKPGGRFRVAVPDGNHPSGYVIDLVRPGGTDEGSDDHRVLYTIGSLTDRAQAAGFTVHPIEYFETDGIFHAEPIDAQYGIINRSSRSYTGRFTTDPAEMRKMLATTPEPLRRQFIEGSFSYTSLLLDLVK